MTFHNFYPEIANNDKVCFGNLSCGGFNSGSAPQRSIVTWRGFNSWCVPQRSIVTWRGLNYGSAPHRIIMTCGGFNSGSAPQRSIVTCGGFNSGSAPHRIIMTCGGFNSGSAPQRSIVTCGGFNSGSAPQRIIVTWRGLQLFFSFAKFKLRRIHLIKIKIFHIVNNVNKFEALPSQHKYPTIQNWHTCQLLILTHNHQQSMKKHRIFPKIKHKVERFLSTLQILLYFRNEHLSHQKWDSWLPDFITFLQIRSEVAER